jgi:cation:H+ antiporter
LSVALAVPLFLASLIVTLLAARLFARRLDRLGVRFRFPEALIGLLTALAADGPEISAALFALFKGAHNVSVGVVVGSNAFNLAAMIGLSGLLAGGVRLPRATLLLEGSIGAAITVIGAAVLLGWLPALAAAMMSAAVLVPYLLLLIGGGRRVPIPGTLTRALKQRPRREQSAAVPTDPAHHLLGLIVLDVALIIAGSAGMVQAALALGDHWHISHAVLGVLVLAPLTSIPNAITGLRLGLAGRGAALVGEMFNSNTINLAAGVIVPALFVTIGALSSAAKLQLGWLIGMTFVTLLLLGRRHGIGRAGACALILMYAVFAALETVSS